MAFYNPDLVKYSNYIKFSKVLSTNVLGKHVGHACMWATHACGPPHQIYETRAVLYNYNLNGYTTIIEPLISRGQTSFIY